MRKSLLLSTLLFLTGCFGTTKVFVFPEPPEALMKTPSDLSVIIR